MVYRAGFFVACAVSVSAFLAPCTGNCQVELDPIRVFSSPSSQDRGDSLFPLIREDSLQAPGSRISRFLDQSPSLDVRGRGPFGTQEDLSVQGGTFEQARVAIDGIPFNDPQTGHYSLDLPITRFDVESINTSRGADFSLKSPDSRQAFAEAFFGQHALFGETGSFTVPGERLSGRISFEHASAKAARPDTDFDIGTVTGTLARESGLNRAEAFFGFQNKEYGASTFYSNLFPQEEEHTRTYLFKGSYTTPFDGFTLTHTLHWRRHWDEFLLRRHIPGKANIHTADSFGADSQLSVPLERADLVAGVSATEDAITSTNLGDHSRSGQGARGRIRTRTNAWYNAEAGAEVSYLQQWHWQGAYDASVRLARGNSRFFLSPNYRHQYRVPSFTELFYADAANRGDPNLGLEKTDTWGISLGYDDKAISWAVEPFYRKGNNLIDWTRLQPTQVWQATNLGTVDVLGIETTAAFRPHWHSLLANLDKASFSYVYMDPRQKANGFLSKYALDIIQHKACLGIDQRVLGVDLSCQFSYTRRYYGETYFLADATLSRQFSTPHCTVTPFIAADNIGNAHYTEIAGVLQPGRWVRAGVRLSW